MKEFDLSWSGWITFQSHFTTEFIFTGRRLLWDWCPVEVHCFHVHQIAWTCLLVRRSLWRQVTLLSSFSSHSFRFHCYLSNKRIIFPNTFYSVSNSTVQRWLTTAPGAPTTHWYQIRCVLSQPIYVMAGQEITGRLHLIAHSAQSYTIDLTLSGRICLSLCFFLIIQLSTFLIRIW